MVAEVVANTSEARDCEMIQGSADKQSVSDRSTLAGEFNSVYDNVVGARMFGIVENGPGEEVTTLRLMRGGTARKVGELHLAFASGCLPRTTKGGCSVDQASDSGRGRGRVSKELASEWGALPEYW